MIDKNKLPEPSGPYRVGYADFELPAARCETFGAHDTLRKGKIELVMQTIRFALWYPVDLERHEALRQYHRPDWLLQRSIHYMHGYTLSLPAPQYATWPFTLFGWAKTANLKIKAYEGAPLATCDDLPKRLPVIVFSHGLDGSSRAYSSLLSSWASYGFVVVSLEHRDGSAPRALIDTQKIPEDAPQCSKMHLIRKGSRQFLMRTYLSPMQPAYSGRKAPNWQNATDRSLIFRRSQLQMRVSELTEALEMVRRLDRGELDSSALVNLLAKGRRPASAELRQRTVDMFKDRLNLEKDVVIAGHSFGAATIIETMRLIALKHLPFVCGICLDPWTQITPAPPDEFIPPDFDRSKSHPVRLDIPKEIREGRTGIQIPLLIVGSTFFQRWEEVRPYTYAISEEAGLSCKRCINLEVKGSNHIAQSDASLIIRKSLWLMPSVMTTDARRVMRLNIKATIEFLGRTLRMPKLEQLAVAAGHGEDKGKSVLQGETNGVKIHYKVWDEGSALI